MPLDSLARKDSNLKLAEEVAKYYHDPLGFVLFAYPWGEPGTSLANHDGPDEWQQEFLESIGQQSFARHFDGKTPVMPIREAISSGHGVGKSTVAAWLVDWILSTRPHSQGTVTANTFSQLDTKTWAAIRRWTALCITGHWFHITTSKVYSKIFPASWFCQAQSCKEENSEAFAGQHAADSTSFYIVDEASAVPEKIFEVAEGGLTDGEPMIFLLGNATRPSGKFYQVCFGPERAFWGHRTIDSRTSKMSNKELIAEWLLAYGEQSDFFRVRVMGLPPKASDAQFIDSARVAAAQLREPRVLSDEPLVAGVDFAWGGEDDNVVRFRRGQDARSIPSVRIKGEFTRDPEVMVNRLSDILTSDYDVGGGKKQRVAVLFLDSAGIAGPVGARLRVLGFSNVVDINFGADSPNNKYVYMRDYMWGKLKDWLATGAIDSKHVMGHLCPHCELEADLVAPGLVPDRLQRVKLEDKKSMKKRGVDSPDDGDALALTFAQPVAPPAAKRRPPPIARPWG